MSQTKHDSLETQRMQLQHYQALITEYAKEYNQIGHQLFKKDTLQSALKTLLDILNSLEDIGIALKDLYKIIPNSLHTLWLPLPLKNKLLLAKIKTSMFELGSCLLVKRPDDVEAPTFDNAQETLAWCMDAVIFYKEGVFYLSQTTRSIQTITAAKHQLEPLNQMKMHCEKFGVKLADTQEFAFIQTLPGVILDKGKKEIDYIDIVKNAEARLPYINYKNDVMLQVDTYNTLTKAAHQLQGNQEEKELVSRYPDLMEVFISGCGDTIVKLSYYHSCILEQVEKTKPTQIINPQIKTYNTLFQEVYRKFINEFERLQWTNKLTPQHKADYLKALYFAHYVRLATHVSLQGNTISNALDNLEKNNGNKEYAKKYINTAIIECDIYFSKHCELFLCQDMQEISNDIQAIYDHFEITQQICTALTNQISHIMKLWYAIKDTSELHYKKNLYQAASTYMSLCLQYYACYNLIHDYLTERDKSKRIVPKFDEDIEEARTVFSLFSHDYETAFVLDEKNEEKAQEEAKKNEKDLLAMHPKTPKIAKQPKKKGQTVVVETKKVTQKSTTKKPQEDKKIVTTIDLVLEKAQQCINDNKNQEAVANFWKAYNLATKSSDVLQRLKAMDGLCGLAGSALAKQLKEVELLAKNSQQKDVFQAKAIALLAELPKLKNTYESYFQLAHTNKHLLSSGEQEAIALSRDLFWTQLITVQKKLTLLLEQNTKKHPTTKQQPKAKETSQEANLQFVLEKHFDDLASENKLSTRLADKKNVQQQFKITLPQNIQCIFEFLAPFKGTHYLVGSMVLQLLAQAYHLSPVEAHDADFISTCNDRASLIIAGFQENYYMRNLYSLYRRFEWSIDLISLPEEENWLISSLNSRDFRVAALSCDKIGTILDSTGQGLEDLKQRRLVMIGDPALRIKQDPVLLLRALKYMVFGFKPDEALDNAMKFWKPQSDTNVSKLSAVARKHLIKPEEAEPFLDLLCHYNLLYKMFGLVDRQALMPWLGLNPKVTSTQCPQRFFNNNQNEQKNEGTLVKQKTVFHS